MIYRKECDKIISTLFRRCYMDKIESFKINHLTLESGLYVSRIDSKNGVDVTTFDMRFTKPNREPPMDVPAMHTIEHLAATYLRSSESKNDIVYFGPMGCRTGFYLLMFGRRTPEEILPLIENLCDFIINFEGDIPGATPKECGNYSEQNLINAKYYIKKYKNELKNRRFTYPEDGTIKAGCILLDKKNKKIALVYREMLKDYSFPKGHLELGESIEECAIRETAEETKRIAIIDKKTTPIIQTYFTTYGEKCLCYMYLATDGGPSDNNSSDTHPTQWIDIENVEQKVSYDNLKELYRKLLPRIKELVD